MLAETPSLLIEKDKMERNIRKMADIAKNRGVNLRPHAKTHKIPVIAKQQIESGAVGITVAKVSEAEVMAAHGIDDIFIAFPIVTDSKIERVATLSKRINLTVGVDSLAGAKRLSDVAKRHAHRINVRLEIDTGLKRTGVLYDDAVKLAHEIKQLDDLNLTGIYTYRGSFMNGKPTLDRQAAGLEEGQLMVALAEQMRVQGIDIRDVSVGSTPTAEFAAQVEGITEIRPGTYVFYDRMQAKMGASLLEECAGTILATIVSRPSADLVIIDGGSKTFATDIQPNTEPLNLRGFGHVVGYPDVVFERLTEEHGMLKVKPHHKFKVGDTVRIIPNHICSTVNLHNQVYIASSDGGIEELQVLARGKLE